MPVFDIHTHIFPDSIAVRTVEKVGAAAGITPSCDGSRQGLEQSMAEAGIDGALNCPIATRPEQVESINRWARENHQWPILSLGSIHPDTPNPEEVLRKLKEELGLPGIKLHPEYQQFSLDDSRLSPIWEACGDLDLLIMLHAGADVAFSPPFRSGPRAIADLLEQYSGLKLIAAHGGSWNMWEEAAEVLAGAPLWIDTSFVLDLLDDEKIVELIQSHGVENVLFGTDAPWRPQKDDLQHFLRLPLEAGRRRAILWDNSARLLEFAGRADFTASCYG